MSDPITVTTVSKPPSAAPPAAMLNGDPCTLVIFGAVGDLARRKLMPAVYDLANRGMLPPGFSLVGFARRDWEDQDFAQVVHDSVREHSRTEFREEVWQQLAEGMRFIPGDFDDDTAFKQLRAAVDELDTSRGTSGNYAFYLSVPPKFFPKGYANILPGIMMISNIRENGEPIGALPDGEMMFHHDMIHSEMPDKATLLYAV